MGIGIGHLDDIDWEPWHYNNNGQDLCGEADPRFEKLTKKLEKVNCDKCKQLIKQQNERTKLQRRALHKGHQICSKATTHVAKKHQS